MAIKAVLFDFWGTLVENGVFPSPVKQVKYILRINVPFVEYIHRFESSFMTSQFDTLSDAFKNVAAEFKLNPPDFVIDKLVGMWNKNTLLAKPFEDTIETLKELRKKGMKICLISNTDQFSVNQVIDKYDLKELFDEIVLSCDVGMLKSDPKMFKTALKRLGVKEEEVIMVGDSIESDVKGAKNAGIRPFLLDRKDRRDHQDKIVALDDLMPIIGDQ